MKVVSVTHERLPALMRALHAAQVPVLCEPTGPGWMVSFSEHGAPIDLVGADVPRDTTTGLQAGAAPAR